MSLGSVKPYFRTRMDALGYEEWTDGFGFDNIPSTLLDKSYHVFLPTVSGIRLNHNDQEVEATILLRVFRKGFRDPAEALDKMIVDIQTIVTTLVKTSDRLADPLKNVSFNIVDLLELDETNDNGLYAEFEFTVLLMMDI